MDKSSTNSTGSRDHFAETIWDLGQKLGFLTWQGLIGLFKQIKTKPLQAFIGVPVAYLGIRWFAYNAYHLKFFKWIWPSLFSGKFLNWITSFGAEGNFKFLLYGSLWFYILALGAIKLREKRKLKERFESIGLINKFGETPILIKQVQPDEYREVMILNAKSIGVDQFESKKDSIEAAFGKKIERIQAGDDRRNVKITFSNKDLPNYVDFYELLQKRELPAGSFYIGETTSGVQTAKLSEFPHMLIAGTTGAGKSVFFKQAIIGLLKSTEHIQVYFIDLKKGLEAADFKTCPNVAIAKDPMEALSYLEKIESEMGKRFKYLESKGFKSIEPKRDRKDLIVVAVDEAAELYAEKSKSDRDYELFRRSQEITDSISRLGRAAGIHLILATQKVNKESINTTIQENISVRMCFRMNTLQGSLQVLGNKDALELSDLPGRGIFQRSNRQMEVQVPYIVGDHIKCECNDIADDFQSGKRKLFQTMLGTPVATNSNEFRNGFIDQRMD